MRSLMFAVLIAFATVPAIAQESAKPVAEAKEYKPPPGYKTRKRGDETYYCRKVVEIGSRFPVESCYTKEQLHDLLVRNEEQRQEFERRRRTCSNPATCGNL
ncbi:MAG: hypothetical protein HW417_100 [Steroidobacteraceae bacterium]|jgi:hypothetical protein|nr:hypothetical protein [Steroidobacteraceae bacterium]